MGFEIYCITAIVVVEIIKAINENRFNVYLDKNAFYINKKFTKEKVITVKNNMWVGSWKSE